LIVRNVAEASPWLVLAASTVLSALAGLISWKLIEQPFNTLKRKSKGGAEGSGVPQRPPEASPQIT
jgi:peptidoglycan/LPS O-acetylase OafA/YrhL